MQKNVIFISSILLVVIVLLSGCTTTINPYPVATPTPQIVYVTVTPTPPIPTQPSSYQGVAQSTANLQMIGNVYGLASVPAAGINEIRFNIGLAPQSQAFDLTTMKITFSTPNTPPRTLTWGNIPSTTTFTTKLNGASTITSINGNEQVEIDFRVDPVQPNTRINFELRPSVGAALPFTKTAPATISGTNMLY